MSYEGQHYAESKTLVCPKCSKPLWIGSDCKTSFPCIHSAKCLACNHSQAAFSTDHSDDNNMFLSHAEACKHHFASK